MKKSDLIAGCKTCLLTVAYTLGIFLIFLGFSVSESDGMMYNVLIMPVSGALGYVAFRWRSVYKLPLLMVAVGAFALIFGIVEMEIYSLFIWTLIYISLALGGAAAAFLFHFAFGRVYKGKGKGIIFRISALVVAVVITSVAGFFVNGLVGNPVSYLLAKRTAEQHIAENYSDTDYLIENVSFSFKDGCYHAYVSSPSSDDSYFSITLGMGGGLMYDTYEDSIVGRRNTAFRLESKYRESVEEVLSSAAFPYKSDIGYGELLFVSRAKKAEYNAPDYALITDELILDGCYDVNKLGSVAGELTLYVCDETVSAERLAEILLDVKRIFDDSGVSFYVIDCILEHPKGEEGVRNSERVEVMDFLYGDIYEEGLAERVAESDRAANEYYAEQEK